MHNQDFKLLMIRLENAEDNITKLKKLTTEQHNAILNLIQLETKLSKKVTDLKTYQDKIIQWGGFY